MYKEGKRQVMSTASITEPNFDQMPLRHLTEGN